MPATQECKILESSNFQRESSGLLFFVQKSWNQQKTIFSRIFICTCFETDIQKQSISKEIIIFFNMSAEVAIFICPDILQECFIHSVKAGVSNTRPTDNVCADRDLNKT